MSYVIQLIEAQKHCCFYCERIMTPHRHQQGVSLPRSAPTKDHLEPRTYGGPTTPRNLVIACSQCNGLRGEIDAMTFVNLMQKWFKRDKALRDRWHNLNREELYVLKQQCLRVYAKQLNGQAVRYIALAFRHHDFTHRWRHTIA
jgi:HNH endonuclease